MIKRKLIVVSGKPNSGKDTFINKCMDELNNSHHVTSIHESSIDIIKSCARTLGWDGVKDDKGRQFLSELKQLAIWYNDFSFNYIKELYQKYSQYGFMIFTQVREPSEIAKLKNYYNDECITVLVKSKMAVPAKNLSDINCENYPFDFVINNNGDINNIKNIVVNEFIPNFLEG